MVKRPAIQEQPLHTAIAHARDSNRARQQVCVFRQALAQQQQDAGALLMHHLGPGSAAESPSSNITGAAQQGDAAESPGPASDSQQHANGSADAQRAQHAEQGHKFESAEPKHAQQGAGGLAGQPSGKAGEGRLGQTDRASPALHDGDHPQHGGDHAHLNGDRAQAGHQAADAQACTSTLDSTDSSGSSQQHSTNPQHSTSPKPGSSRTPQPDTHQHKSASSDSKLPSPDSAPAPATPSAKPDQFPNAKPQSTTANPSHTGQQPQPQPQPSATSQQQAQSEGQAQDPGQGVLALPGIPPMPATWPPINDLRCVLGNREQVSMLDGLQALVTGLTIKLLTHQVSTSINRTVLHCL